MLKKVLSPQTCAKCRICCCFDDDDIWETPVIEKKLIDGIGEKLPEAELIPHGGHYLFKMEKEKGEELYFCPGLDREKGCTLGSCKPFDCTIWPFRVMKLGEKNVLTLSPVCPNIGESPFNDIMAVAAEVAPKAFAYAKESPEAVKDYISGYPILAIE